MPYTLWSRGRLLGHTTLGYAEALPGLRAGDFEPTELGDKLMPIITGVGPALKSLCEVAEQYPPATGQADGDPDYDYPEAVRQTTEYADAVSLADELESLALELRDEYGQVVPAEHIWLNDTEYLIARSREAEDEPEMELSPEMEADIAHDVEEMLAYFRERDLYNSSGDEPSQEPKAFPRYQIFVNLESGPKWTESVDDWADDDAE